MAWTKLVGLRKLKKLTLGSNEFAVAPFKVYSNHSQIKDSLLVAAPRLLVRTDELSKQYGTMNWASMPRFEVLTSEVSKKNTGKKSKALATAIQKKLGEFPVYLRNMGNIRLIIHPLPDRNSILYSGSIVIDRSRFFAQISLRKDPNPNLQDFRGEPMAASYYLLGKILIRDEPHFGIFSRRKRRNQPDYPVIDKALRFLKLALKKKMLQDKNHELSFVVYKTNPNVLEFFDFRNDT